MGVLSGQKILVTGGAGFIGSHVIDRLLADGNSVVCVDNLYLGRMENINHHLQNENFTFVKVDILDASFDEVFAHNFDWVFHMAANSDIKASTEHTDTDLRLNLHTTLRVMEGMRKHGVKNLFFCSTSAIYGRSAKALNEDHGPAFPVSLYGASKLASEAFISAYVDNFGLQAWITRFPNVVGERATHGILFDFIKKLRNDKTRIEVFGDGKQRKPYIYVKDLVEAILFVCRNSNERLNYYNIAPETDTSVTEITEMMLEETRIPAKIDYTGGAIGWVGDVSFYKYDISKIKQLGWHPSCTSNEYMRKAIRALLAEQTVPL